MPLNLDTLPFDILFGVSLFLDIEDVVHLSHSTQQLSFLLKEETLCRRLIESCAERTLEGQDARGSSSRGPYQDAVRRIYKRRKALANGSPASASVVTTACDFIFNEGILCSLQADGIQVLDLHANRIESRLTFTSFLNQQEDARFDPSQLRLLGYSEGMLAMLCPDEISGTNHLLAVNVQTSKHVITPLAIENPNKIFVRLTKDVLFFGCHTAPGSRGFREWVVQGISLTDEVRFKRYCRVTNSIRHGYLLSDQIQFHDFPGSDIGSTVAFRIHEGYFYALTNLSAFDVVEVDWTSFYHCVRFPIHDPRREHCQINERIYRRQHHEGPINDSWTELSWQVDETTNELFIVEARSEWTNGATSHTRTFYAQRIPYMNSVLAPADDDGTQNGPADDLFSTIPDDDSKYMPWQEREDWQFHPERAHSMDPNCEGQSPCFILARTKFRSYNFSASTFLDLVQDACECRGFGNYCLRLRVGSRRPAPYSVCVCEPSLEGDKKKEKARMPSVRSRCPSPIPSEILEGIPSSYRYNPIAMWPLEAEHSHEAADVHKVMNLDSSYPAYTGADVKAVADERTLVYLIRPSGASSSSQGGVGKVVCVCFDSDASVTKRKSIDTLPGYASSLYRSRKGSEDDELKDFGPPTPLDELPHFEPEEASFAAYESIWDDYPDAEDIDLEKEWLYIFTEVDCAP